MHRKSLCLLGAIENSLLGSPLSVGNIHTVAAIETESQRHRETDKDFTNHQSGYSKKSIQPTIYPESLSRGEEPIQDRLNTPSQELSPTPPLRTLPPSSLSSRLRPEEAAAWRSGWGPRTSSSPARPCGPAENPPESHSAVDGAALARQATFPATSVETVPPQWVLRTEEPRR